MSGAGPTRRRVVVIGVGNPFRSDDGVGPAVAAVVRANAPPGVEVLLRDGEPTALLDAWADARLAVVVDAIGPGNAPGRVQRFEIDGGGDEVPDRAHRGSSHALGIGDAVALGRALGRMPERLVVFGIEGSDFGDGTELTPAVAEAIEDAGRHVMAELAEVAR